MRKIDGKVVWLKSLSTNRLFPVVTFSGDTDMATAGLIALTSTNRSEVVITEMTADERDDDKNGDARCEKRINHVLQRSDLRHARLLRVGEVGQAPNGLSFDEFLRQHSPLLCIYRDIYDLAGEAVQSFEQSFEEFKARDGIITFHGLKSHG